MANEFIIRKGYKSLAASEVTGSLKTTGDITVSGTGLSTIASQLYVGQTSDYFGTNTNIQLNSGASNKNVGIRSNILYLYSHGNGSTSSLIFGDGSANFGLFSNDTEFKLYNYGTSSSSITVNRSTHATTFAGSVTATDYRSSSHIYLTSGDSWIFRSTGGSERMRVLSSGDIAINRTSQLGSAKLTIQADAGEDVFGVQCNSNNTTTKLINVFNSSGTDIASITINNDSTPDMLFNVDNGSGAITQVLKLDSSQNATFAGSTTSDKVNINQAADEQGLEIKGYDDHSSSDIKLQINSSGHARLSQTTDGGSGYLFLQAENYLQLIAGSFIYTQNTVRIYDNAELQFGNSGDYKISHKTSGDKLIIHTDDNKGITIDNAGNTTFTEDVVIQGTLTAQEFNTELVSASILFESGSTILGNSNDDTHDVTGTLNLTSSAANTILNIGNSGTGGINWGIYSANSSSPQAVSSGDLIFRNASSNVFILQNNLQANFYGHVNLVDNKYLMWGGNSILQHTGTATNIGDNSSGTALVLSGGNATFSGVLKIPSYIEHVGDTDSFFGFNSTDTWKLRLGGGDRMIVDTNRISSNVHISLASGKYLEFLGTGALLNVDIAGWTSGQQEHNILYAGWTSSTGDYLSLRAAGNSAADHGNLIVGDSGLWYGIMDGTTSAAATDSATNPHGDTNRFRVDSSGNGTFAGNLEVNGGTNGITVDSAGHASVNLDRASTSYDNNLIYRTNGTIKWRLWQDGSSDFLHIRDEANSSNMVSFQTGGNTTFANSIDLTAGQVKLRTDVALDHDGSSLYIKAPSAIYFYPGNTNKGNLSTGGTLTLSGGVSATSGTGHFSLVNASAYQLNGTYIVDSSRNLVNIGTISSGDITVEHANSPKIFLKDTTNNLQARFRVANSYAYLSVDNPSAVGSSRLVFQVDGSEALHLDSSHNATFAGDITVDGGDFNLTKQNGSPTINFLRDGTNPGTNTLLHYLNFKVDFDGSHQDWGGIEHRTNASSVRTDLRFNVKSTSGNVQTGLTIVGQPSALPNTEVAGTLTLPNYIYHTGDTNTYLQFETDDTWRVVTGGGERLGINNSGVRIGGGARVTTILDEDNMSSNSATALATQQSIKAYVDANAGGISNVVEDTTPQLGGNLDMNGKMLFETDQRNSIDLVDHASYTWLRNAQGGWAFQQGTSGDNWTLSYNIFLPAGNTAGNNDQFMQLGQRSSNATNGSYKGTRIVQYKGGVVDGQLKASLGYFSGDTIEGVTDSAQAGIFLPTANRGVSGLFASSYARNLIRSDGSATIEIGDTSSLISLIKLNAGSSSVNGVVSFMTKNAERMRVHHDGNVGIGTTSPSTKLHVNGGHLRVDNSGGTDNYYLEFYESGAQRFRIYENSNNVYFDGGPGNTHFRPRQGGGSNNFIVTGANVGIGTTAPTEQLHVSATAADVLLQSTTSGQASRYILKTANQEWRIGTHSGLNNNLWFYNQDTAAYRMTLTPTGNLGLNFNTPSYLIHASNGANSRADIQLTYNALGTGTSDGVQMGIQSGGAYLWNFENSDVYFGVNNAKKMSIKPSGNVGIGTTTPAELLEVNGSIRVGSIKIQNVSAGGRIGFNRNTADGTIYNSSYEAFQVQSNGSGYLETQAYNSSGTYQGSLYFTTAGNLGIGNSSTAAKLDVEAGALGSTSGDSTTAAIFRAGRQNLIFRDTRTANGSDWNNATFKIIAAIDSTNHQSIDFVNDNGFLEHIDIRTGNQVFHSRFTHNGRLGIGTTSPLYPLHVVGNIYANSGTIFIDSNNSLTWGNSNQSIKAVNDSSMTFTTGGSARMTLTSTGELGIGTTSPGQQLTLSNSSTSKIQIKGHSASNGLFLGMDSAVNAQLWNAENGYIRFATNDTERMRIDSSGNVGIGATSPTYKLQVQGTGYFNETVYINGDTTINANLLVDEGIIGNRKNFATREAWTTGTGTKTGYFGGNFGSDSAGNVLYANGPFGSREVVMETVPDTGNDYDGGWNKSITGLDINKIHMSIVYVRRTTSQASGNFYHGTGASANQILNIADGTQNNNPYFIATGVSILPQDVWCVSIGFIQANNDSGTSTSYPTSGLYRLDTGQRIAGASNYKFGSAGATLGTGHRTFLYYSTDNATKLQFARPGFYECNGDEPTFQELVGRTSALLINSSGNPTLAANVTAAEVRSLIGAGTSDAGTLDGIDSSQFLRSDTGDTVNAYTSQIRFPSNTAIESSAGNQASLEVYQGSAGSDAFMAFHVSGDHAAYFGLDGSTNDLAFGGWSQGANKYKVFHAGNDGAGSGLDADTLDGQHASAFQAAGSYAAASHNHAASEITSGTFAAARIAHNSFDIGDTTAETGRNVHETGIYTFNVNNNTLGTGTDQAYYSVLGFGQGAGGSAQIAAKWTSSGEKLYYRSLRDTTDNWWSWKEIWHAGSDGAGSGLDADLLDSMQPKSATGAAGSNQILRTHSNGYLYMQNWIDIGSSGLFSTTTNGLHFYANGASDYGTARLNGSRGGYNGLMFDSGGTVVNGILSTSTTIGLFNDVNNEWLLKGTHNEGVQLYYNNGEKLKTTSAGVDVTGTVTHDGLAMTSGTSVDQLYSVNMTYTLAANTWTDTGINSSELATGTYAIQLFVDDHSAGGGHYDVVYSGMMSWYGSNTNSSNHDEIVLHRVGHATNTAIIQLRTLMHSNAGDNVMLQIKQNFAHTAAMSGTTDGRRHNFKFRRLI